MKSLLCALLVLSITTSHAMAITPGGTLNLYLRDDDLNTSRNGIDVIQTAGLLEFTINGISIEGPKTMKETSTSSGVFVIELSIPTTINGRSLATGDVLLIKYNDQNDLSGKPNTVTKSIVLSTVLSKFSTSVKSARIGEEFTLKLYEPDWNLDSQEADTIPLNLIEFRTKGIRTTLANSAFDTPTAGLRETGPNTNLFVVNLEIPRQIDGKTIKIGSTVEFRFTDTTSPSSTSEVVKTTLKVGHSK